MHHLNSFIVAINVPWVRKNRSEMVMAWHVYNLYTRQHVLDAFSYMLTCGKVVWQSCEAHLIASAAMLDMSKATVDANNSKLLDQIDAWQLTYRARRYCNHDSTGFLLWLKVQGDNWSRVERKLIIPLSHSKNVPTDGSFPCEGSLIKTFRWIMKFPLNTTDDDFIIQK